MVEKKLDYDLEISEGLTAEEMEAASKGMKGEILFAIGKDVETGAIEICPMNDEKRIVLHGAQEVEWFIKQLIEVIQS